MSGQIMFVVLCEAWHSKRYPTEGQAERKAKDIDHMGNCPHPHNVVAVEQDEHHVWRDANGMRMS